MARIALIGLCIALAAQTADFEHLYRQAFEQRVQTLGRSALKTRESARDLALYLANRGDHQAAEPFVADAMSLASDLPDAAALHNWAVAVEQQNAPLAEQLYRRALVLRNRLLPANNPELAMTRLNLALLLIARPSLEAGPLAAAALKTFDSAGDRLLASTASACGVLGAVSAMKGDIASAERHFRRALQASEKAHGPQALPTASALENLADLLEQTGRESAARPLLERAQRIRTGARQPVNSDPVIREGKVR